MITDSYFAVIIYVFILLYTPLSFFQIYRLFVIEFNKRIPKQIRPNKNRRVITLLVTNGANPEVASNIIAQIKQYRLNFNKVYVIKEYYDNNKYGCKEIVIPKNYKTKNNSRTKERALQYAIEWLQVNGLVNKNTFLLHLDDDSTVGKDYIKYIVEMPYDAAQGKIRLRSYGKHLFSTLADMIRPSDCDIYCDYFNSRGKPKAVHGEGLVIRSDIEYKLGWDYSTYCGEDFLMGQKILANGFRFGLIPYNIYISPPLNTKDFYKQRRRWMYGVLWSLDLLPDKKMTAFLLYRYTIGWAGFFGVFMLIIGLLTRPVLNSFFLVLGLINLVSYFLVYQKGVMDTNKKYILIMLLLQIPIAIYEGGTLVYSTFFKPDKTKFEVIKKA
jgi:cellulose synthase/poly-beta-1,6-N-acetylglucosamine synthase-like glycosyltransferase